MNIVDARVDGYDVTAECAAEPAGCSHCGAPLVWDGHSAFWQRLHDVPIRGVPVRLRVRRRQYRCGDCGRTSGQPLTGMDRRGMATERFVRYVTEESRVRSVGEVARELGVDERPITYLVGGG